MKQDLRSGRSLTTWQRKIFPYVMIAPNLLIFGIFIVIPAIYGLWYSLHSWSGIGPMEFVGLSNYKEALTDRHFWGSMERTVIYVGLSIPLLLTIPLGFALLLSQPLKGVGIFRGALYWPNMISFIVAGIAFKFLFNDDSGVINYLLQAMGSEPVRWLTRSTTATLVVILATIWQGTGFYMIIYIAGLQSIPSQYYEAASIDGASRWQKFRHITLPLLRPTTFMVLTLGLINLFKTYGMVMALTGGGPVRATKFIVQLIYDTAFVDTRLGYASAISFLLFIIVALITTVQFALGEGGTQHD